MIVIFASLLLSSKGIIHTSISPILESNNNQVFAIDENYILKRKKGDSLLSREFRALQLAKWRVKKIPEPVFFETDEQGEFLLMKRLSGYPIGTQWNLWDRSERRNVITEIVSILKDIHSIPVSRDEFRETWFKREYVAKSYRQLLEDVFSDGLVLARKNPHVNEGELLRVKGILKRDSNIFEHSMPSFVHHDFWYKNILVDKNGFTGVIDFEFFGQVPVQVELFTFLHSRLSAKNYLDEGSEDYVELEFLEMLLSEIERSYPELKSCFNTGEFLLYNACKYVSMLTKWEESWYSHHETIKFYDTFLKEELGK